MYGTALRRLLEMYPAGASKDQILWRMKSSGLRVDASGLLQSFSELSANGEVDVTAGGRWQLSRYAKVPGLGISTDRRSVLNDEKRLIAVPLTCGSRPADILEDEEVPEVGPAARGSMDLVRYWKPLMNYYAATQRSDPRGKISQFTERHGTAFQLITTVGDWWSGRPLSVALTSLPDEFREALVRRKESTCAIGYPLTIIEGASGHECFPALLLAAERQIIDDRLILSVAESDPVINPDWLKEVTRRTRWNEQDLVDVMLPEDESRDIDAVTRRMRNALAKFGGGGLAPGRLDETITLERDGLRNAAAIFLAVDRSYTQGTAADLEVMAELPEAARQGTALAALLGGAEESDAKTKAVPLIQLQDLTERQFDAACDILSAPLSVVQGPPGTGKSDVIVSVIASAIAAGQSVLFASKNHQALDEVEQRLASFCGEVPVLVRGRDGDGERNTNFLAELKSLALTEPAHFREINRVPVLQIAAQAEGLKRRRKLRAELELQMAAILDRLSKIETTNVHPPLPWYMRWISLLLGRFDKLSTVVTKANTDSLRTAADKLHRKLSTMDPMPGAADFPPHDEAHKAALVESLRELFTRRTILDPPSRTQLQSTISELEFSDTKPHPRNVTDEDARLLLRHRPVWLISSLSVPSRVPLVPGLFDLLIMDEASQCDIASSLPLFHRAKRAAVVGDPLQLGFIPGLSVRQEHALMDHAGLPRVGRAAIAQSKRSLFEFADSRPVARTHFLADQFRSAGDIVDYLNEGFYANRLRARRSDDQLTVVPGHRPGIDWVDVKGKTQRIEDANVNDAEAKEIARRIVELASDTKFTGSIGALTPFVGQVNRIITELDTLKGADWRKSRSIKIATIDKFQGGEADVVYFSLVVTAGAPIGAVSFLQKERRRFNVAISRAKAVCIVVGDLDAAKASNIPHLRRLAWHTTRPQSDISHEMDSRWEEILFGALKNRGRDPSPQYEIGRRRLDFALFAGDVKLDVEVDGRAFHTDPDGQRKTSDLLRDKEMIARGWKVRRFWVSELERNMEKCLDLIDADLNLN